AGRYLARLAGDTFYFVPGSHDKWMREEVTRYVGDDYERIAFLPPVQELMGFGTPIVLCHYAMRTWPGSFHGSLHLYGHSHGRLERTRLPRSMDVGVDVHNFYPVSLAHVLAELSGEGGYERG
ncbi:MAG: hypothetical protein ACREMG_04220, partial [Gemmatimonadales bacterium]